MYTYSSRLLSIFLGMIILFMANVEPVLAQYTPPQHVTLTVYRLVEESGALYKDPITRQDIPCTKDDPLIKISYGCTAKIGNNAFAYPFNDSTITISIESEIVDGIQQGYLHNVLSTETPPENVHSVAVAAQAIAARTYV